MEYLPLLLSNYSLLLLGIAGVVFVFSAIPPYTSWRRMKYDHNNNSLGKKSLAPPEVAGAWLVFGHLRQLSSGKQPLVRTLGAMADEYGPIFSIRVGMQRAVIISSWETAMDSFSTNDKLLADRPPNCAGKYMGYEYAVLPFALHGPFWRSMRKLVVVELLSNNTLEKLKPVWMSELDTNLKELYNAVATAGTSKPVNMSEWFGHLTLNLIVKLISGRRYKYNPNKAAAAAAGDAAEEEARCMTKVFKEIMFLVGELAPGDSFFPTGLVRWLDFGGQIASMKRVSKAMDDILENWIEDHKQRRRSGGEEDDRDFIDVMLSVIDQKFESGGHSYSRETIMKAASLSMLEDAADTLGLNLEWVLSLLLNNPLPMKKAREEIDTIIGSNERWADESDIREMVYLQAAVKEAMRLYPAAPLLVPHRAIEDCTVGGYTVAKGTVLYANAWKIHRDPRVWPEPEKFSPERFLGAGSLDDREAAPGRHFGFIPFGIGRRSCPGMSYAKKVTHLTVARLLQGFDVTTPGNVPVDMGEGQATTLPRATPLEVHITPRLPSSFYRLVV
ncbi:unnamed protein product [Cuscuta epithymum]|uniref:Uncharacterized protein n=1 Tax=Cuscuta epithymum TaxID=186058 RepID=A0AAV0E9A1_9ASTE|nr:unnamed protein product [Cuscuta epithymum]